MHGFGARTRQRERVCVCVSVCVSVCVRERESVYVPLPSSLPLFPVSPPPPSSPPSLYPSPFPTHFHTNHSHINFSFRFVFQGGVGYALFIGSILTLNSALILSASALLGLSAAIIWTAQVGVPCMWLLVCAATCDRMVVCETSPLPLHLPHALLPPPPPPPFSSGQLHYGQHHACKPVAVHGSVLVAAAVVAAHWQHDAVPDCSRR